MKGLEKSKYFTSGLQTHLFKLRGMVTKAAKKVSVKVLENIGPINEDRNELVYPTNYPTFSTRFVIPIFGNLLDKDKAVEKFSKKTFSEKNTLYLGSGCDGNDFERRNQVTPEVCFFGKSNVGKSSLLNHLMNRTDVVKDRKQMARVSRKPGYTEEAHFFGIDPKLGWKKQVDLPEFGAVLVDLPGYGSASGSKLKINKMNDVVLRYFNHRQNFKFFVKTFLLIDSSVGIQAQDFEILRDLSEIGALCQIVLTKLDKLKAPNGDYNKVVKISETLEKLGSTNLVNISPIVIGTSTIVKNKWERTSLGISELRYEIMEGVIRRSTERARGLMLKD